MSTLLARLAGLAGVRPKPLPLQTKLSAVAPLIALQYQRQPVWSPRDYATFAREGFAQNPVVYRSVRMIAEAAASVPVDLFAGDTELTEHPLLDLLNAPNPTQTRPDLLEAWYGFLLVAGNAYMEAVGIGTDVRELYVLRPDRMTIVPGADGWPLAYDYTVNGQTVSFSGEAVPGVRKVLHLGLFHPSNDYYGLSPIEAAATAIDIHNAASAWNKAMLDNSALPSGALVYNAGDRQLTPEQYERLKAELEAGFQGARNAGRPMLLEGGLDWRAMSMSPKDMDFIESKRQAARDIALALGVPPMLLGIPGDNKHDNYRDANRAFWRETVLPLVGRSLKALSGWLGAAHGGGLELRADLDAIEALSDERDALWKRVGAAAFLTDAEKRAAVGYGPDGPLEADADSAVGKFNEWQPRVPGGQPGGGQWSGDGGGGSGQPGAGDTHTSGDGGTTDIVLVADQPRQYTVVLEDEEKAGLPDPGHTIRDHVGKTDAELITRLMAMSVLDPTGSVRLGPPGIGTFTDVRTANDLVNRVLEANKGVVDQIANGTLPKAMIRARFGSLTGREAFFPGGTDFPEIRNTFAVCIRIAKSDASPGRGYRIDSAFPCNREKSTILRGILDVPIGD